MMKMKTMLAALALSFLSVNATSRHWTLLTFRNAVFGGSITKRKLNGRGPIERQKKKYFYLGTPLEPSEKIKHHLYYGLEVNDIQNRANSGQIQVTDGKGCLDPSHLRFYTRDEYPSHFPEKWRKQVNSECYLRNAIRNTGSINPFTNSQNRLPEISLAVEDKSGQWIFTFAEGDTISWLTKLKEKGAGFDRHLEVFLNPAAPMMYRRGRSTSNSMTRSRTGYLKRMGSRGSMYAIEAKPSKIPGSAPVLTPEESFTREKQRRISASSVSRQRSNCVPRQAESKFEVINGERFSEISLDSLD